MPAKPQSPAMALILSAGEWLQPSCQLVSQCEQHACTNLPMQAAAEAVHDAHASSPRTSPRRRRTSARDYLAGGPDGRGAGRSRPACTSSRRRSAICATSRCARSRRWPRADADRLRGHPRHPQAARPLRHRDAADALSRAQRRGGAAEDSRRGSPTARRSRWSPTPARRWSPTPATSSSRDVARGRPCRSPRIPGASAVLAALVAGRAADRPLLLRGLSAAEERRAPRARLTELARIPGNAGAVRERPRASPRCSPMSPPCSASAPAAVARELTKLLRERPARHAAGARARTMPAKPRPRGEIVVVIGAARRRGADADAERRSTSCCARRSRASR